jgi:hypothetical protein
MKEEERRKKVGFICVEKKSGWQLRGSIDRHRQEGAGARKEGGHWPLQVSGA